MGSSIHGAHQHMRGGPCMQSCTCRPGPTFCSACTICCTQKQVDMLGKERHAC